MRQQLAKGLRIGACLILALIQTRCSESITSIYNEGGYVDEAFFAEMPFESDHGKIIISARVNGKSKRFLLATGTSTAISESVFYELNQRIVAEVPMRDALNQNENRVLCSLDNIEMGGANFRNIPAVVLEDENPMLTCFQVDGIIGSNVLRNVVLHIDKQHSALILTDDIFKLDLKQDQGFDITLEAKYSAPSFLVQVNGKAQERVIFDTGLMPLLSTTNDHLESLRKYGIVTEVEAAFGYHPEIALFGNTMKRQYQRARYETVDVAGMQFKNVVTTSLGDVKEARLGAAVLDYAAVTVDYKRKRMYCVPYADVSNQIPQKRWPVSASFYGGKTRWGLVWQAQYKALQDQVIVSVDERKLDLGFCQYAKQGLPISEAKTTQTTFINEAGKEAAATLFAY